jgi:hypothetical protein
MHSSSHSLALPEAASESVPPMWCVLIWEHLPKHLDKDNHGLVGISTEQDLTIDQAYQ